MSEADFYRGLLVAWFALSALVFVVLQFLSAPYGRHARSGWGPSIPDRAAWVLMELPALLTFPILALLGGRTPLAFVGLWVLHYANRTLVYPLRTQTRSKRMPILIALLAAGTNVAVGYLLGRGLGAFEPARDAAWLRSWPFLLGTALFLAGFAINQWADAVLIRLRRPGETGYRIPEGGLYRFVSCPNYLGEIVEWAGFALATSSWPALAFLAWTLANLVPRAAQNHAWYRATFDDYPRERRALVPFVW